MSNVILYSQCRKEGGDDEPDPNKIIKQFLLAAPGFKQ